MMNNLFQFHGPAVKKLLGWKRSDDDEKWAEKAVDYLVKKLKKRVPGQGTIEDLEYALTNPGVRSKCVAIPRSLDGRLQVSHRKGLPHVIYCRVWRWPDLHSHHELRPMPECLYPYQSKRDLVCINPYHYQRVKSTPSPSSVSQLVHYSSTANTLLQHHFTNAEPIQKILNFDAAQDYAIQELSLTSVCQQFANNSSQCFSCVSPSSMFSDDNETKPSDMEYSLPVPDCWCNIAYYELNSRVGEMFKVTNRIVIVDGFTDPSNSDDRICLGPLTNVNRNFMIENTRKHIGKGVRLCCESSQDVFLTNLSDAPIFVQSVNCSYQLNTSANEVFRMPPGHAMCVFRHHLFLQLLKRAENDGYESVYKLTNMCFIKISFVKGWGNDYHRQDVTSTPCWIEIQLHTPLQFIDQVISTLEPPSTLISSVS